MKIAFLAMSGLRAHDPDLLALGLTLPGVIERGKVITSMPSLGLLWLASSTPIGHDIAYYEAPDALQVPEAVFDYDIVAISALTAQAFEAHKVAQRLRNAGIATAFGGLHATVCPDESLQHFDHVFVGEAESSWPAFIQDFQQGRTKRLYRAADYPPVEINELPPPRYDLLKGSSWNRFPVQTTRGCPWRCDFCASSIMLDRPYRKRPVADVVRDIDVIKQYYPRPFIELADDNTFVDKRWGRELCLALAEARVKWFTETDISVADDGELLRLLRAARCRQLLIGLESPSPVELGGIELKADFKARTARNYVDGIRRIQDAGVTVNGCFVLGLDHQGPDIFDRVYEFAMSVPLYEVQVTMMTPFPGTPLYDRLLNEDRILEPGRWDLCTLFDVNFRPAGMTVRQLREGMYDLVRRLYTRECIDARRRPILENLWRRHHT